MSAETSRAVDVEPGSEIRHEQPTGPTARIERRLAGLDVRAELVDLRAVEVELRPPARDEAVVPGRRGGRAHAEAPRVALQAEAPEPARMPKSTTANPAARASVCHSSRDVTASAGTVTAKAIGTRNVTLRRSHVG